MLPPSLLLKQYCTWNCARAKKIPYNERKLWPVPEYVCTWQRIGATMADWHPGRLSPRPPQRTANRINTLNKDAKNIPTKFRPMASPNLLSFVTNSLVTCSSRPTCDVHRLSRPVHPWKLTCLPINRDVSRHRGAVWWQRYIFHWTLNYEVLCSLCPIFAQPAVPRQPNVLTRMSLQDHNSLPTNQNSHCGMSAYWFCYCSEFNANYTTLLC